MGDRIEPQAGRVRPLDVPGPYPRGAGAAPQLPHRRSSSHTPTSSAVSAANRSIARLARASGRRLEHKLGGQQRTRVIVVLACVLALSGADAGTVGASATQLRRSLHISNTDIGLLVAVTSVVGALASLPFGVLADRVKRTRALGISVVVWALAMVWSATVPTFGRLLLARAFLGLVTASAGPIVASLIGDYFAGWERGKIYSWVLTGELLGAGFGFAVTGDIAVLSWRAAFIILAIPTFVLARYVFALPEPVRGGSHPLTDEINPIPPTASASATATATAAGPGGVDGDYDRRNRAERGYGAGAGYPDGRGYEESSGYRAGRLDHHMADRRHDRGGRRHRAGDRGVAARGAAGPGRPGIEETDVQRLARLQGVRADPNLVAEASAPSMGFIAATRYILKVRTNVVLILASACGYFYLAGVETFGVELTKDQYRVGQAVANVLLIVIGAGAVIGVLVAGRLSDWMVTRGYISARITTSAVAATATVALFIPALLTRSVAGALPYLVFAGFMLQAQNPPIDAARLDIMPARLWGRAEGVRTALRTGAQALAPVLFGGMSDYVFGGGRNGLKWTFIVMLLPLAFNAVYLFRARKTYPGDVATAAAAHAVYVAEAVPADPTVSPPMGPMAAPERWSPTSTDGLDPDWDR